MVASIPTTPCRVCGVSAAAPFTTCFCCATLVRQLRMPLVPLTAVTSFRAGDVVHRRLRGYKDVPVAEVRAACRERLAAMLEAWLARGRSRELAGAGWDTVVTVPSSTRPAGAPVGSVITAVPSLAPLHRPLLVRGPEPTGHLRAARRGFSLRPGIDPDGLGALTILVVDDCVVTGARAQSAAAALRAAGAEVAGVLALGRLLAGAPAAPG